MILVGCETPILRPGTHPAYKHNFQIAFFQGASLGF